MTNNNNPVDSARLQEFTALLQRYKSGKASIERRAVAAENRSEEHTSELQSPS